MASHDIETVTMAASLPRYPYSHIFLPNERAGSIPMGVHMRYHTKLPDEMGVVLEVVNGVNEVKRDVHYLLSNTLVTHWAAIKDPFHDDQILLLAGTCWVAILPLVNFARSKTNPYAPPLVLGWRKPPSLDAKIEGGVVNSKCFARKPSLHAICVTLKKQKGSLHERKMVMLRAASAIHLASFKESDPETPNWVTTPILVGKFKIDKKRHTTRATWLLFPAHEQAVKDALASTFQNAVEISSLPGESDY
jgi:hypothetical protein